MHRQRDGTSIVIIESTDQKSTMDITPMFDTATTSAAGAEGASV